MRWAEQRPNPGPHDKKRKAVLPTELLPHPNMYSNFTVDWRSLPALEKRSILSDILKLKIHIQQLLFNPISIGPMFI